MSGKSSKSKVIGVRLPMDVIERIEGILHKPSSTNTSLSDYCKVAIIRYVQRHDKEKGLKTGADNVVSPNDKNAEVSER